MNQDQSKSRNVARGAQPVGAGGRSLRYLTIVVAALILGGVWVIGKKLRKPSPAVEITSVPTRNGSRLNNPAAPPAHAPAQTGDATSQPAEVSPGQTPPSTARAAAIPSQEIAR